MALVAVAVYLVVMRPTATVASANLLTKLNVQVQCASVWSQWTNQAKPPTLALNGQPLTNVAAAQNSCASASTTIKRIAEGGAGAGIVLAGLSFWPRRRRH
jgi:hypothetical protein